MARLSRLCLAQVSLAALLLCPGLVARAQTAPEAPSIVLPPPPEAGVTIDDAPVETPPAIQTPALTAPAIVPPVVVETTSPPRAEPPAAPPVLLAAPEPPPAAPAAAPVEQAATPPAVAPEAPPVPVRTAAPARTSPALADIGEAIHAALDAASRERVAGPAKQQRDAIQAVYAARGFAPLWLDDGGWTKAALGARARLEKAGEDAIDVKAAPAPILAGGDEKALADTELALTRAVVAYGVLASGGRFDPRSIGRLITDKPEVAEASKILAAVSGASDGDAALDAFNPPHAGYRALRDKLADMRRDRPAEPPRVGAGPTLKVGMKDPRVPSLRARFALNADPATITDELVYDSQVAAAVAAFQRSKGLPAFGLLNPATVAALSDGDPAKIENEIIANMERWRWLPRAAADSTDRVEVNIPDFTVRVTRNGALVHTARVVVGKPDTPTPVFSNRMKFLEVNPYWNVPESIIRKEMMPKLAADPTYLHRLGYEVSTDRKGQMVVRQPPGEKNALGFIKFMFPNEHAVYLHDTPSRSLFANPRRAYSHGCVRVDMPFKLAEIVLGKDNGWSEERVKKLIGTGNKTIHLPKQIDVHIEYFTTFVDDAGKLQLREDIYGYSRKLRAAMGLS